jgi:hypothetical protein
MSDSLHCLIHSLREELQQYGEMLALLDHQQELVTSRAADALLESTGAVEAQTAVIHRAREARLERQAALAHECGLPGEATIADLLPCLPADYRPLLAALVQENNELLMRVQMRSRQNHVLLTRSLELMTRLIGSLLPSGSTVYSGRGVVGGMLPTQSLYQAMG